MAKRKRTKGQTLGLLVRFTPLIMILCFLEFNIAPQILKEKPRKVPLCKKEICTSIKSIIKTFKDQIIITNTDFNINDLWGLFEKNS